MEKELAAAESFALAGQFEQAVETYEGLLSDGHEAIGLILYNLIPCLIRCRRFSRALAAAHALTYHRPDAADSWMILNSVQERLGDQDGALASVYRTLALLPADRFAHEARLYLLSSRISPLDYLSAAREWFSSLPSVPQSCPRRRVLSSLARLRVGYVSGDYRRHVMERLILPLLTHHSARIEVHCFDNSAKHDAMSAHMRSFSGPKWHKIAKMDDSATAQLISDQEIDILVDLSGLTGGNRLDLFRRRPAPIQLTGYGYYPTTGADCFDWRLGDIEVQAHYSERLWRLDYPNCPLPLCPELPVSPLPFTRNGFLTFGYVNAIKKLTPPVVAEFIRVLQAVPASKLLVATPAIGDEESATAFLRRFDPVQDRILLTEAPSTPLSFCRLFSEIDVALEPFSYGGGVTAFECIYHGVPMICYPGDRRIGQTAAMVQAAIGAERFIASHSSFTETARQIARNPTWLVGDRGELRHSLIEWNTPARWVAGLEQAYFEMAAEAQQKEAA